MCYASARSLPAEAEAVADARCAQGGKVEQNGSALELLARREQLKSDLRSIDKQLGGLSPVPRERLCPHACPFAELGCASHLQACNVMSGMPRYLLAKPLPKSSLVTVCAWEGGRETNPTRTRTHMRARTRQVQRKICPTHKTVYTLHAHELRHCNAHTLPLPLSLRPFRPPSIPPSLHPSTHSLSLSRTVRGAKYVVRDFTNGMLPPSGDLSM